MKTRSRLSVQRGWVEERRLKKKGEVVYMLRYRIRDESAPNGWRLCSEDARVRSKRAAQRLLQQRMLEVNEANARSESPQWRITFQEFADTIWQDYLDQRETKRSTRYSYCSILKTHVLKAFGSLILDEITPARLSTFLARLRKKGLSAQTRLNIYALLRTMFVVAVEHDLMAVSPVRRKLHRPKVRRSEKPALSPQEIRRILSQVPSRYELLFSCLVVTGLRIGEMLALRWRNVDWERRTLSVTDSVWRGQLERPKTAGSEASLHLPDRVIVELQGHFRHSRFIRPGDFVFARRDGSPLDPNYVRKFVLYPALDAAGIERGRRTHGFHLFRHSAASIVHERTRDLKLTQTLLRHTQLSTTADIYVHAAGNGARLATEPLAEALLSPQEGPVNCSPYCSLDPNSGEPVN